MLSCLLPTCHYLAVAIKYKRIIKENTFTRARLFYNYLSRISPLRERDGLETGNINNLKVLQKWKEASGEEARKLRNSAMRLVASLDVIPALETEMSLLLSLPLSP